MQAITVKIEYAKRGLPGLGCDCERAQLADWNFSAPPMIEGMALAPPDFDTKGMGQQWTVGGYGARRESGHGGSRMGAHDTAPRGW